MMIQSKIQKWGNSSAVRLSTKILAAAGIAPNAPVDIEVNGDSITIKAHEQKKPQYKLAALLAMCTEENMQHTDEMKEWDNLFPTGKEEI